MTKLDEIELRLINSARFFSGPGSLHETLQQDMPLLIRAIRLAVELEPQLMVHETFANLLGEEHESKEHA